MGRPEMDVLGRNLRRRQLSSFIFNRQFLTPSKSKVA